MEPIAITGMACRFPGAPTLRDFWSLLIEGREGIVEIPADRWDVDAYFDADPKAPGKTNARTGGFIEHIDRFDAAFFGIAPREAAQIDPQQRILLELAYDALEDAGIAPAGLAGSDTAVFVGAMTNDYFRQQLGEEYTRIDTHTGSGGGLGMLANRLSYQFDLRGPSLTVDTACSSSLVAVMQACQSLWSGQSRLALAAGVNVILDPSINVFYTKAGLSAADGRCKTFSAAADGIGRAEGGGVVVLKPLRDALADGDAVYAVIRGGAVNHDGRSNGMTQPNRWAQERLLRDALRHAGVDGGEPQYIELHGTGTLIGDPIEANALAAALGDRGDCAPCLVGSVKTNFGHLEAAAGIAGLIKLALSMEHGAIPPSLWFDAPNPHIPFDRIPLRVNTRPTPWQPVDGRRIGGVSSFGLGGANAHVVIEHAVLGPATGADAVPSASAREGAAVRCHALLISARSETALKAVATRYLNLLADDPRLDLSALCATATARKGVHDLRAVALGRDAAGLAAGLEALIAGDTHPDLSAGRFRAPGPALVAALPALARIDAAALAAVSATAAASAAWDRCRASLAAHGIALPERGRFAEMAPADTGSAGFAPLQFALQYALLSPMLDDIAAASGAVVAEGIGQIAALAALDTIGLDEAAAWLEGRPYEAAAARRAPRHAVRCAFASGIDAAAADVRPSMIDATARCDMAARIAALEGLDAADVVVLGDLAPAAAGATAFFHPLATEDGWCRLFAGLALRHPLRWEAWAEAGAFMRLPGYPWQRESYWLAAAVPTRSASAASVAASESAAPAPALRARPADPSQALPSGAGMAGSLLGARVDLPTVAWQRPLDARTLPYLPDHCVQGAVLLPGAGYVEIGFAVHAAIESRLPAALCDLSFRQALMVEADQSATLHVTYDRRQREFAVHSRLSDDAEWTLHALGRLGEAPAPAAPVDVAALKARCTRFTDGDTHYANMRLRGFGYGPAFQGVRELWLEEGGERVLARIVRPPAIAGDREHEHLHPALFDASLQSILTTLTARGDNSLYIPTGIDSLALHRPSGDAFWCYGGLQAAGQHQIKGEIVLFDDEGRVIAEARGVRAQALTRRERDDPREIDGWLYAWEWRPAAVSAAAPGERWLLLLDDALPHAELAERLRAAGCARVVVARPGEAWSRDGDDYVLPRGDLAALDRLLDEIGSDAPTGAVYGWQLSQPSADAASAATLPDGGEAAAPLLRLLERFGTAERSDRPRCLVLTRRAQSVAGSTVDADGLRGAALLGLARVAVNEFASLRIRAVDLDGDPQIVPQLAAEILSADDEEEVAWRAGQRHGLRMVRSTGAALAAAAPSSADATFSAHAAYLITGGFGGFGLEAAEWMVAQGARHLALVGRRGAGSDEVRARLDALRTRGATVLEFAADIAQEAQVLAMLERIRAELPPLDGVFHAAAALDDAPIAQLTSARIDNAMAAKCLGALHLHRHTADDPLRHFVLFSSISAMVGGSGQASYAMACAYLDALARYRRGRGQAAISINWGALRDVGMATRFGDVERLFEGTGLGLFSPAQAVKLLGLAMDWGPVELGIAKMDWPQWARLYPTWKASAKYRHLLDAAAQAGAAAAVEGAPLRARLLAAAPEAREAGIADLLAEALGEALGCAADAVDRGCPLPGLGLDSMMALDLLAAIETALGVKVPMLLVMNGNSADQLTPLIAAMLMESAGDATPLEAPPTASGELPDQLDLDSVERFIAGLGDLDDAQIEHLLHTLTLEEDATT